MYIDVWVGLFAVRVVCVGVNCASTMLAVQCRARSFVKAPSPIHQSGGSSTCDWCIDNRLGGGGWLLGRYRPGTQEKLLCLFPAGGYWGVGT